MTISKLKAVGWVEDDELLHSDMNNLDTELVKCIDGSGGGTYNPTSTLAISNLDLDLIDIPAYSGTDHFYSRRLELMGYNQNIDPSNNKPWQFINGTKAGYACKFEGLISGAGYFRVPVSAGTGELKGVNLYWTGSLNASHSSLPATLPQFSLIKVDCMTGSKTTLVSGELGTSLTATQYDGAHNTSIYSSASYYTNDDYFVLEIDYEAGANCVSESFGVTGILTSYLPDTIGGVSK